MNKLLLPLLLAFAALGAQADPVNRPKVCNALAEFAASIADKRAGGMPKDGFLMVYEEGMEKLPGMTSDMAFAAVERVYAKRMSAAEARADMWTVCVRDLK